LPAFKGIVVNVHVVVGGRDGAAVVRVVEDEVGIRSELNGAFAGVEAEDFCGLGASDINELIEGEAALFDAVSEEDVEAVFEGGDAIGNFGEVVESDIFLAFEVEGSVIGSNGADEALAEGIPEDLLVFFVAQWGRHDVFSAFEVGEFGVRVIED
jgi:hypothetical protein